MSGTPKTLSEAVKSGIDAMLTEYLEKQQSNTITMHKVLKDFISQKINAAMLEYPENEGMLMELFNKLTK